MQEQKDTVTIHVNLDIEPAVLQAIVGNAKILTGRNEKGHYQVDTAELVGTLISEFLMQRDFEAYVADTANYPIGAR